MRRTTSAIAGILVLVILNGCIQRADDDDNDTDPLPGPSGLAFAVVCEPAAGQRVVVTATGQSVTWPQAGVEPQAIEIQVRHTQTFSLIARITNGTAPYLVDFEMPPTFRQGVAQDTASIQHVYPGPYETEGTRQPQVHVVDAMGRTKSDVRCPVVRLMVTPPSSR
jgi:hypothetical protein